MQSRWWRGQDLPGVNKGEATRAQLKLEGRLRREPGHVQVACGAGSSGTGGGSLRCPQILQRLLTQGPQAL